MAFTRILCPLDLSPLSRPLLARAIALAEGPSARVHAFHALDLPRVQSATIGRRDTAARAEADHLLEEIVRDVRLVASAPVAIETEISDGAPGAAILGRTRQEPFDLIVMGTHTPSRAVGGGFGSTLGRVLCATRVPVLAWPAQLLAETGTDAGRVISHVTAAIDFGNASIAAARLAADVARRHRADLTLLYVPPSPAAADLGADAVPVTRRRHTLDELACVAAELEHDGPPPAVVIRDGTASEEIAAAGAERPGTLVVIGLRRASWTGVPPGSMTLRVLRAGRHPVLAVPAPPLHRRSTATSNRRTSAGSLPRAGAAT